MNLKNVGLCREAIYNGKGLDISTTEKKCEGRS